MYIALFYGNDTIVYQHSLDGTCEYGAYFFLAVIFYADVDAVFVSIRVISRMGV